MEKQKHFIISKITNVWVNLSELVINAGHISPHNKKCKKKKKKNVNILLYITFIYLFL